CRPAGARRVAVEGGNSIKHRAADHGQSRHKTGAQRRRGSLPSVSSFVGSVPSQLVSERPESATRRLDRLTHQRETLRPLFLAAWNDLADRFGADEDELEAWAGG